MKYNADMFMHEVEYMECSKFYLQWSQYRVLHACFAGKELQRSLYMNYDLVFPGWAVGNSSLMSTNFPNVS